MEKLNELVELAKKATSGKWIADSGEGWDAIISQQDMVNGSFIISEFIGPDSKANKDFVLAASPENILAIAEAFRALEQEVQKNLEGALAWQQRAEAAEAKLAELKEQKADFHVRQVQTEHGRAWAECGADYERGRHFFTHPAPAINLAELVLPVDGMPDNAEESQEYRTGFAMGCACYAKRIVELNPSLVRKIEDSQ